MATAPVVQRVVPIDTISRDVANLLVKSGESSVLVRQYQDGVDLEHYSKNSGEVLRDLGRLREMSDLFDQAVHISEYVDRPDSMELSLKQVFTIQLELAKEGLEPAKRANRLLSFDIDVSEQIFAVDERLEDLAPRVDAARARHAESQAHEPLEVRDLVGRVEALNGRMQELLVMPERETEIATRLDYPMRFSFTGSQRAKIDEQRARYMEFVRILEEAGVEGVREAATERREEPRFGLGAQPLPFSGPDYMPRFIDINPEVREIQHALLQLNHPWWEDEEISGDQRERFRSQHAESLPQRKKEIAEMIAALPDALRGAIYGNVYKFYEGPKGGPKWGEKNVVIDLKVTERALEAALEAHPEFMPRMEREADDFSDEGSDIGRFDARFPMGGRHSVRQVNPEVLDLQFDLERINHPDWEDWELSPLEREDAERRHAERLPAYRKEVADRIAELPDVLKGAIYGNVYKFYEGPKGGPKWGEKNVAIDLKVTERALEAALEEHPEFKPRVEHVDADDMFADEMRRAAELRTPSPKPATPLDLLGGLVRAVERINEDTAPEAVKTGALQMELGKFREALTELVGAGQAKEILDKVYGYVYAYAPAPKGGPNWGEKNACKSGGVLLAALRNTGVDLEERQ